ncbi:hypothetical protein AAEP93_002186 [Penicillium crustosum]
MKDPKDPKPIVQRRSIQRNPGQDTSDTLLSRWTRVAVDSNYGPFGQSTSSIEETVLEDVSESNGNAPQDAALITEPNFDEQGASPEKPAENHEHPVITTTTPPSASTSMTNISFAVVQCLKDLSRLVSEDLSSFASEVPPALWKDELGRLRVWAANIGAHQTGQSSLDHRLRDASHIKEQTLRVLQRLQRTIEDINDILHHSSGDDDFSDLSGDEDDDDDYQTEMQSIYHALRDTINNLFQMSMLIRQPAQHDRLLGTKRSDAVFYEQFDIRHVSDKYPQAGEDISKRLGLAISQRRAVMQYRERHRTKLGQGLNQVIEDQTDGQSAKLSDTVATEFVEVAPAVKETLELLTVASQTSYAQTILNGAEGAVLPSPPKDSADGAPFECPYCFVIITIPNRRTWARHVFNDLMPYLCIFPSCPTPHRLYESRREWFSHLQSQHSISKTPNIPVDCPLCLCSLPSGKQFERHVGRHLEELSLFALPRSEEDDDEGAISSDEDSDKSHDPVNEGRCPQCDLVFVDLRAHAMTHNETERLEKCPIGVMVCHFCPGAGTPKEKSFTRVDVFKRHLITVHGVMQLQPNQLDQSPISSIKTDMDHTSDSTGNCSICNEPFEDAQDFYKHIDNCVMLNVMQGSSEPVNNMRLPEVSEDEETVDDRRDSSSSVRSQNEEKPYLRTGKTRLPRHLAHMHAIMDLGYPFKEEDDMIVIQKPLSKAQIDEVMSLSREFKQPSPAGDSQSTKKNNLSGADLGIPEPAVGRDDALNFGPGSSKDLSQINEDVVAYDPDSLWKDHPDESEPHENELKPDIIYIHYRGDKYSLHFRAYAIEDGVLTVGALRMEAARKVGAPLPNLANLLYNGVMLRDDNQACKKAGIKQNSEVICVVSETKSGTLSDSFDNADDERAHASNLPRARSKVNVNKNDKQTIHNPPLRPKPPSSPSLPGNIPSPPPNLKLLHTPMEQVTALAEWFEHVLIPICEEFIAHPPDDPKKREYTHRKLSETILAQVMLKVDGIDPDGDDTARSARRALVRQAQHVLNRLDSVAGV